MFLSHTRLTRRAAPLPGATVAVRFAASKHGHGCGSVETIGADAIPQDSRGLRRAGADAILRCAKSYSENGHGITGLFGFNAYIVAYVGQRVSAVASEGNTERRRHAGGPRHGAGPPLVDTGRDAARSGAHTWVRPRATRTFLAARRVLGTFMLWFERRADGTPRRPGGWRRGCLATVGTGTNAAGVPRRLAGHPGA
jgi:hypothetical protein